MGAEAEEARGGELPPPTRSMRKSTTYRVARNKDDGVGLVTTFFPSGCRMHLMVQKSTGATRGRGMLTVEQLMEAPDHFLSLP
jgi:hypothetical protein